MKIEQSNVSLFSSYQQSSEIEETHSLHVWNRDEDAPERLIGADRLELSGDFMKMGQDTKDISLDYDFRDAPLDSKLMAIIRALEALMGKKIDISKYNYSSFSNSGEDAKIEALKNNTQDNQPQRLGWGIDYNYSYSEISKKQLDFLAKGSLVTQDGVQIDFKAAFSINKNISKYENFSFKAGDALIDPLVVNFDGNMVTMGSVKHKFDLNLDGKDNEFSFVGSGSGFLALDKNGDGKINDGSELFGPTLGDGFRELMAYDEDANMWIDENDTVFEKLLIWTKDENGDEDFYTLKEKNVGALYLGSVSTAFDLENNESTLVAKMRQSSIYLTQDAAIRTLQEIDLVV